MIIPYTPWVGQRYHQGAQIGGPTGPRLRLLVMGESHYDPNEPDALDANKTIACVQEHIAHVRGRPYATYTKILSFVHGEPQSPDMREESWSWLAFNNYLLAPMEHPRQSVESRHGVIGKDSEILQASQVHFLETCRQLMPDLVIALGKVNVYQRIASLSAVGSPAGGGDDPIQITDGTERWWMMWVRHPSQAFSREPWHAKLRVAVDFIVRQRMLSGGCHD